MLNLLLTDKYKNSSDMEDKIWNLLVDYGMNEKVADQCVKELLVLCNVVGQSEQFSLADMKEAYEAGENNAGSYTYPPFEEWFSKR